MQHPLVSMWQYISKSGHYWFQPPTSNYADYAQLFETPCRVLSVTASDWVVAGMDRCSLMCAMTNCPDQMQAIPKPTPKIVSDRKCLPCATRPSAVQTPSIQNTHFDFGKWNARNVASAIANVASPEGKEFIASPGNENGWKKKAP